MDYVKIYNSLVANKEGRLKSDGVYYENHHILPKSMNGDDSKGNLVLLTAKEHYLAHRLLTKVYPLSMEMKMALLMMSGANMISRKGPIIVSSSMYEKLRKDVSEARKSLAFIPNCIEFDNNIRMTPIVACKLIKKWRWGLTLRRAVCVVICNGVFARSVGFDVCYRRSNTAYNVKTGKCASTTILKAIDMLIEMGYIEEERSDSNLPLSKRKLSSYKLTDHGYFKFSTKGEKI